jgi:ATP-binding cassette subfamily B protein
VPRLPRTTLLALVVLGVVQAAALVLLVLLLRLIVTGLETQRADLLAIVQWILALAGVLLLNALFRGVEFAVAEQMGYEHVRRLRMTMYAHLAEMAPRQLQFRSRGGLLLRFTGDLTMLRTWISRGIARGIVSLIVLIGGTAILAYLDPWIALAVLGVLVVGAALSLVAGNQLRRTTRWVRRKRTLLTSNVDEQVSSLATVQAFGRSAGEFARMARQNDSLTRTLRREARIRGLLRGIASGTAWLAMIPVLLVGAFEVSLGRSSLATVVTAATAARFLIGTVRDLGLTHDYWQRAKVSRRKIDDFLRSSSMRPDEPELEDLRPTKGRIAFADVTVPDALRGLNAVAEPGQLVAIVGPSGSGKSALLQTVARLLEPSAGTIRIDDQVLGSCSRSSARRFISLASSDVPLMRGTVRRNLTYRRPDASPAEVERIVRAWHLGEAFGRLEGGLDGWITEGGHNLSTGIRQRLVLARAFLGNPRILLLDNPTANLDAFGVEIYRRLVSRHAGTVLVASHDPDDAMFADVVWVMHGGTVVETIPGPVYQAKLARGRSLAATGRPA